LYFPISVFTSHPPVRQRKATPPNTARSITSNTAFFHRQPRPALPTSVNALRRALQHSKQHLTRFHPRVVAAFLAWKMTTFTLASGKANVGGALKKSVAASLTTNETSRRHFGKAARARNNGNGNNGNGNHFASRMEEDPQASRDLFMNVLTANATKRDAKQYLSRFNEPKSPLSPPSKPSAQDERNARHRLDQNRVDSMGVNLGGLYAPARAIANTPQFTREILPEKVPLVHKTLHTALVSLRSPESLSDELLDGLATTLSQLVRLDMRILLAIDCVDLGEMHHQDLHARRQMLTEQGERLVKAISEHSPEGARFV
jgi:amino-acid N-acetyltransferase